MDIVLTEAAIELEDMNDVDLHEAPSHQLNSNQIEDDDFEYSSKGDKNKEEVFHSNKQE